MPVENILNPERSQQNKASKQARGIWKGHKRNSTTNRGALQAEHAARYNVNLAFTNATLD